MIVLTSLLNAAKQFADERIGWVLGFIGGPDLVGMKTLMCLVVTLGVLVLFNPRAEIIHRVVGSHSPRDISQT